MWFVLDQSGKAGKYSKVVRYNSYIIYDMIQTLSSVLEVVMRLNDKSHAGNFFLDCTTHFQRNLVIIVVSTEFFRFPGWN